MATIVAGVATSHAPTLVNYEMLSWFDPAPMDRIVGVLRETGDRLRALQPDAIVVFSNDHFDRYFYDNLPPFLVGVGETAVGPVNPWMDMPVRSVGIASDLARHIVEMGLEGGVDFSLSEELALDHAETIPLGFLTPDLDIPIVPIVVNAFAPPMPSLKRCFDVGAFVGEAIRAWPEEQRVVVLGTGGLSHWFSRQIGAVNSDFDRWFLDRLVERDCAEVWAKYAAPADLEEASGEGGHEIRQWLATAGAIGSDLTPQVAAYEIAPGVGLGVMTWL